MGRLFLPKVVGQADKLLFKHEDYRSWKRRFIKKFINDGWKKVDADHTYFWLIRPGTDGNK